MSYLSFLCLWVSMVQAAVPSILAAPTVSEPSSQGGLGWYTVTSAGALWDKAGPYALSGCVSQSPISVSGFLDVEGYCIVSGFWSSECNARFNRDRDEVLVSSLKPEAFKLYCNYPNPFRISTRVDYDLPVRGQVCLSVYDATGRQVRELAGGWQEAGRYSLNWDGKDKTGRRCPSGVYFCSLQSAHQKAVKRMLFAE
jgi:hypothetical protein